MGNSDGGSKDASSGEFYEKNSGTKDSDTKNVNTFETIPICEQGTGETKADDEKERT